MRFSENFKSGYKDLTGRLFFPVMRRGESQLSPDTFYSILKPFFFARAAINCAFRKDRYAAQRPDFLRVHDPARTARQQRMNDYLNHVLEFFPERMAGKKWTRSCTIEGFEHWQSARRDGRPIVLAFCHFGPLLLLRCLLRSAGIPAATVVGVKRGKISPLKHLKDRLEPLQDVPLRFFEHQFRAANEFLAAGNALLIAIDTPAGMQMDVPLCDGWTFQMSASSVRFAVRHQADLIPCTIVDEGRWRFTIKLGRPVPRELLSEKDGWLPAAKLSWLPAGKHLIDELVPIFRERPEQCHPELIRCLKNNVGIPIERGVAARRLASVKQNVGNPAEFIG
jgi:hypothetical protein